MMHCVRQEGAASLKGRDLRFVGLMLGAMPLLTLSACGSYSDAEDAVKATLRDPASAQFQNMKSADPIVANYHHPTRDEVSSNPALGAGVCGEVNSKNAFGGYTGFRKFAWIRDTGQVLTANKHGVFEWNGPIPISGEDADTSDGERLPDDFKSLGYDTYCLRN